MLSINYNKMIGNYVGDNNRQAHSRKNNFQSYNNKPPQRTLQPEPPRTQQRLQCTAIYSTK